MPRPGYDYEMPSYLPQSFRPAPIGAEDNIPLPPQRTGRIIRLPPTFRMVEPDYPERPSCPKRKPRKKKPKKRCPFEEEEPKYEISSSLEQEFPVGLPENSIINVMIKKPDGNDEIESTLADLIEQYKTLSNRIQRLLPENPQESGGAQRAYVVRTPGMRYY
jgi:hypothetical protein